MNHEHKNIDLLTDGFDTALGFIYFMVGFGLLATCFGFSSIMLNSFSGLKKHDRVYLVAGWSWLSWRFFQVAAIVFGAITAFLAGWLIHPIAAFGLLAFHGYAVAMWVYHLPLNQAAIRYAILNPDLYGVHSFWQVKPYGFTSAVDYARYAYSTCGLLDDYCVLTTAYGPATDEEIERWQSIVDRVAQSDTAADRYFRKHIGSHIERLATEELKDAGLLNEVFPDKDRSEALLCGLPQRVIQQVFQAYPHLDPCRTLDNGEVEFHFNENIKPQPFFGRN